MTLPTPDRQAEFLATTPNVTVATIRPDGLPQLTPNWFLWTGDVFWISTAAATVKTRNLRRDPRIVLCVDDVPSGDYVQVTGTATLIEGDAAREPTPSCAASTWPPSVEAHWETLISDGPQLIMEVHPTASSGTTTDRFQPDPANAPWAELSGRPSWASRASSNGSPGPPASTTRWARVHRP